MCVAQRKDPLAQPVKAARSTRCTYAPLTKHEIELIRACLDDGTYTKQEQKDINALCNMALRASGLAASDSFVKEIGMAMKRGQKWKKEQLEALQRDHWGDVKPPADKPRKKVKGRKSGKHK